MDCETGQATAHTRETDPRFSQLYTIISPSTDIVCTGSSSQD